MRIPDTRVPAVTVFCCLAVIAIGCGGSTMKARFDGAVDSAADIGTSDLTAADAAQDTVTSLPDGSVGATTTMAAITFRFKNAGTGTVYVHRGCMIPITVTALADGTIYGNDSFCGCNCASPSCNGGVECGQCAPDSGIPIAVGSAQDVAWMAQRTSIQTQTGVYGSFQCEVTSPIPTGAYRVTIEVYSSAADATNRLNPRTVEQTFDLGTANATVEVTVP